MEKEKYVEREEPVEIRVTTVEITGHVTYERKERCIQDFGGET